MNIWILENSSGLTVYYYSFMKLKINEHLVSGLISALNQFTMAEFNQPIEAIDMGGFRWCYILDKGHNLLFVASDTKSINTELLKARLEVIRQSFVEKYQIDEGFWKVKWHGDMGMFRGFDTTIEQYYSQWTQVESVQNIAEFFDILGIFQQILNMIKTVIVEHTSGIEKDLILKRIQRIFDNFMNQEEVKQNPELSNITFSREAGVNIISINPSHCDVLVARQQIFILISDIIQAIKDRIGHELSLVYFDRVNLFMYLFNNISLLKELNIENFLLQLFLS